MNREPGRRFAPFFTAVCIHIRRKKGWSMERVADLAGVGSPSIKRFEEGKTFPNKNLDSYAAAYAHVIGIDPRDVYSEAIDWWRELGAKPLTTEEAGHDQQENVGPTAADILESIRLAERERDEAEAQPTSTRRKRASGE